MHPYAIYWDDPFFFRRFGGDGGNCAWFCKQKSAWFRGAFRPEPWTFVPHRPSEWAPVASIWKEEYFTGIFGVFFGFGTLFNSFHRFSMSLFKLLYQERKMLEFKYANPHSQRTIFTWETHSWVNSQRGMMMLVHVQLRKYKGFLLLY